MTLMRILVTAGAGFIGSCFIRQSIATHPHDSITNLDLLTYAGDLENLASLPAHVNYRFVRGDIDDAALVAELIGQTDAVVHFRGRVAGGPRRPRLFGHLRDQRARDGGVARRRKESRNRAFPARVH